MPLLPLLSIRRIRSTPLPHREAPSSRWILEFACDILKLLLNRRFSLGNRSGSLCPNDISTQPPPPRENARLQVAHEDQCRRSRAQPPPRRGPQARLRQRRAPRLIPGRFLIRKPRCQNGKLNRNLPRSAAFRSSLPRAFLMSSTSKPAQRQTLAHSRLRKHADYLRAYAAARKRHSAVDELVSAPRANTLKARVLPPRRASASP